MPPAGRPDVADFTLANGLEVVVIPDHRAPVVTHMIWYKVGAADETPGKSGLAHFLEHLMFKGTAKIPAPRSRRMLPTSAARRTPSQQATIPAFFQRVPREHLKEMMAFEADRMTGLVLTDEVVRPELKVVLEEQNMRVANNPGARLGEQMDAALYLNHPYGRPVIGWRHEIEKLDPRRCARVLPALLYAEQRRRRRCRRRHADEVKADAEETYGKVAPRAEIAPRQRPKEPAQEAPRTVTLADPRVEQPSLIRALSRALGDARRSPARARRSKCWPMCSAPAPTAGSTAPWSSTRASRVNAGAYYVGTALDYGKFGVYGAPKPGISLHDIEAAHRCRARRRHRPRHHRRRTRPRQDPVDRRRRLCAGQSGDAGALVRRGAGDRPDRRHGPHLARPHPRRDGGCRATSRPHLARSPPLGDGLPGQKPTARGEATRERFCIWTFPFVHLPRRGSDRRCRAPHCAAAAAC